MQTTFSIDCPVELLLELNLNAEKFGQFVKTQTALHLFKEGKISSGIAAQWLNIPRVIFLFKAMEAGAELLENFQDDFEREISLL